MMRQRPRSHLAWIAGVAFLAVCLATAVLALSGGSTLHRRPAAGTSLIQGNAHGVDMSLPGGGVVTDGFEVLRLTPGAAEIRVVGVRLVDPRDAQLVGAVVTGPHRKVFQFTVVRGFPSHLGEGSRPAIGTVVTAAPRGWSLLLGVKVGAAGYPGFRGVEITYTSNRRTYRQVFPGVLVICADAKSRAEKCRAPSALESPAPAA
jgi:hypothetical protein